MPQQTATLTVTAAPTPLPTATQTPDYTVANKVGSQFSGGGKFTHQGNYLYYANDGGIYKQPITGGTPTLLVRQAGCFYINVIGDNIYFAANDGVFSADIYSGQAQLVFAGSPQKLIATEQYLYFSMQNSLICYNLSDKTHEILAYSMQDFELCGTDVIIINQNENYGIDLTLSGDTQPIISQVSTYAIDNGIIYAETIDGMMAYDSANQYNGQAIPISFNMVPSVLYCTDTGLLYLPRNSQTVYSADKTTGNIQTIIDNVDEFYFIAQSIIYRSGEDWYCCTASGWQRNLLTEGLPQITPATLSCSILEFRLYDAVILSAGQTTALTLLVNGQPATNAQLELLGCYIKDNTVLSYEITGDVITVTAVAQGSTVLRVASSEKNVFAEVLVTVE